MGLKATLSVPRDRSAEAQRIGNPRTRVVDALDLSGSMKDYFTPIRECQKQKLAALAADDAVRTTMQLALVAMSGPTTVGAFDWVDRVKEPPCTPGQWSEIGGMADAVAKAFHKAEALDRKNGVVIRTRYALITTDGLPSCEDETATKAGFEALASVASDLRITVQVIGVPGADMDNLLALSHGTKPIQLGSLDIASLFAWVRDAIRTVSLTKPGAPAEVGKPKHAI